MNWFTNMCQTCTQRTSHVILIQTKFHICICKHQSHIKPWPNFNQHDWIILTKLTHSTHLIWMKCADNVHVRIIHERCWYSWTIKYWVVCLVSIVNKESDSDHTNLMISKTKFCQMFDLGLWNGENEKVKM